MKKQVFYLSTCSTCIRILKELDLDDSFELIDIKKNPLNEQQVDELKDMAGTYEALFSKRAMKYKSLGLKDKNLQEPDFRHYLLEDYTFLKRPVFVIDEQLFIGNAKSTVEQVKTTLS